MPSSHLILCRPLLLLPPIPSSIRVFSNESTLCMRWPKYWSFSLSISPSNEHPGPVSFRMDWLDLLAVQGTLKSLLQHHSSKTWILWHSAFFTVQLWWVRFLLKLLSTGLVRVLQNRTNKIYVYSCVHGKSLQSCMTLCDAMDCSPPGSSVHGISRQEHWSGLPCPPLQNLPDPGIQRVSLMSPPLAGGFFNTSATWEACRSVQQEIYCRNWFTWT